jgi:DNA-binding NarL/FixJ family response regulator
MNLDDVKGELSEREKEILKLTAKGSTNKEIAREINLSERTVKAYLAEIFFKLNVNNRTEAAIAALHSGIISLDD